MNHQEKFLELCKKSLKTEELSMESNFFFEGGNSISAIRLISNIQKEFHVTIGLEDIFSYPEIQQLYELICKRIENTNLKSETEFIVKAGIRFPLTYAQQGIWFDIHAGNQKENLIGFAINLKGKINKQRLAYAIQQAIHHFLPLQLAIRTDEHNQPYQEIILPPEFLLETDDVSQEPDKEAILSEYFNTFTKSAEFLDIEKGITYRFVLVRISENKAILYGLMHHIVCDDSSVNLFVNYLEHCYMQEISDEKQDTLFFQYCQQEKYLNFNTEALNSHIRLIEVNCPEKENESGYIEFFPDTETLDQITEFCSAHNLTESMFMQAAFALTLNHLTNEQYIPIGMPVSGRGTAFSDSFGMYVNMTLIIADCSEISKLLSGIRRDVLQQIENQIIPFHKIAEDAHLPYELRKVPFRFLYNYLQKIEPEQKTEENIFRSFEYTEKIRTGDISFFVERSKDQMKCLFSFVNYFISTPYLNVLADTLKQSVTELLSINK